MERKKWSKNWIEKWLNNRCYRLLTVSSIKFDSNRLTNWVIQCGKSLNNLVAPNFIFLFWNAARKWSKKMNKIYYKIPPEFDLDLFSFTLSHKYSDKKQITHWKVMHTHVTSFRFFSPFNKNWFRFIGRTTKQNNC